MANHTVLEVNEGKVIYKSNNGGIRFQMRTAGSHPQLQMIAYHYPNKCMYKLTFGYETKVENIICRKLNEIFTSPGLSDLNEFREYYLTWHSNKIKVGLVGQKPFVDYQRQCTDPIVGYCLFQPVCINSHPVEWIVETSPVILKSISDKEVSGTLRWCRMRHGKLPPDAMIGGFENELIYIARADHNGSMCPGKYVPSTGKAFVPWGHREHAKDEFQILCGLDAKWVKTHSNYIPQNAFIGGYSEVNNQPLYIGRAMIKGRLICGKVHVLYCTCYLPFQGREMEVSMFEILVIPGNEIKQALPFSDSK